MTGGLVALVINRFGVRSVQARFALDSDLPGAP